MSFLKNVTTLASGTATAQLINILSIPILSRLFAPNDFGTQAVYLATTTILLAVYTGGYEHAVVAEKNGSDAWLLVRTLSIFGCAVALPTSAVVLLLSRVGHIPWFSSSWQVMLAACWGTAILAVYQLFYFWLNRNARYRELSRSRLISAAGVNAACASTWFLGIRNGWGLILGHVAGSLMSAVYLGLVSRRVACNLAERHPTATSRTLLRRYSVYPKYLVFSSFLDRTSRQLHIFMISAFWGNAAAGHIGMYRRAAGLPSSLIGSAVGDVFRQRAAAAFRDTGECTQLFKRIYKTMALIAFPPALALVIAGPDLFAIVLGQEWREAGVYGRILAPMFFLSLVVSPLTTVIYLRQATRVDLYIQVFLLVSVSSGLLAARELGGAHLAVLVFGLIYCVKYIIEFLISRRLAFDPGAAPRTQTGGSAPLPDANGDSEQSKPSVQNEQT